MFLLELKKGVWFDNLQPFIILMKCCVRLRFYLLFMVLQVLWTTPTVIFPLKTSSCCRWLLSIIWCFLWDVSSCSFWSKYRVKEAKQWPKFRKCSLRLKLFVRWFYFFHCPEGVCVHACPQLSYMVLNSQIHYNELLSVLLIHILWKMCICFWV